MKMSEKYKAKSIESMTKEEVLEVLEFYKLLFTQISVKYLGESHAIYFHNLIDALKHNITTAITNSK